MFTGLIQTTGTLKEKISNEGGAHLFFECPTLPSQLKLGDSVACNGVCLSADKLHQWGFSAYAVRETLEKTNLSKIPVDGMVNFELPVSLADKLGGHMVSGHVDGCGTVANLHMLPDESAELTLEIPHELSKYCISKGSIALNGVSLTLASVYQNKIVVALIPITLKSTNLSVLKTGDKVNIEVDMVAKYLEKMINPYFESLRKDEK